VNPLSPGGRENNRGLYGAIPRISIFVIIAAVIVSWIGTGPAAAAGSPLLIMILWFVILAIAIGTVLLSWKMRGLDHLMKTAVRTALAGSIIAVLGLAAAFISGDKFDAIRAAIISTVLMIINYSRRRNWERDGVMNLRGMNE
jgi:uncharacterized protein YacL